MLFTGDVSLAGTKKMNVDAPEWFFQLPMVLNLEGALVHESTPYLKKKIVVNDYKEIQEYISDKNVYFNIANNHILDNGNIKETLDNCKKIGVECFGAGENLNEASTPLFVNEDILILTFGWSVIECKQASEKLPGVNPLKDKYVKSELNRYRNKYPNKYIIILFHWDYELEAYPMPSQRRLAFELIDLGCDAIIGAHPHRVQGSEIYKNKPIVYSLGNWLFEQGVYFDNRLRFPEFCNLQLAFEFCINGDHKCHFFENVTDNNVVKYIDTQSLMSSGRMNELSPFRGMSFDQYDEWFKKNRYHKKVIPIYYSSESYFTEPCKNLFNYCRTSLINILVKLRIK
ncbi:CapA family protein [Vibrio fluvialis]|uniref:CapA family protein n=1 Tax=Vibrio fluvialis TaxID=676 RepID=UPI0015598155|nr:CapA family protein [Vibrio fluvialis]QKE33115.1 CapA family protein [Vibrio fluvialis]